MHSHPARPHLWLPAALWEHKTRPQAPMALLSTAQSPQISLGQGSGRGAKASPQGNATEGGEAGQVAERRASTG